MRVDGEFRRRPALNENQQQQIVVRRYIGFSKFVSVYILLVLESQYIDIPVISPTPIKHYTHFQVQFGRQNPSDSTFSMLR